MVRKVQILQHARRSDSDHYRMKPDINTHEHRAVTFFSVIPRLHDEAGSTTWLVERSARRALDELARRALDEPARRASFIV